MARTLSRLAAASAIMLAAIALPAQARQQDKPRPVTDRSETAESVVTTPIADLNLKKDEIPPLLVQAQASPYALAGLGSCARLSGAISQLDEVLGDDIDMPQQTGKAITPGGVAKSVVASFIPFRGVIREISGANAQDRKVQAAAQAGAIRRGFLKGVGQQRGCAYPARPATAAVIARAQAAAARERAAEQPAGKTGDKPAENQREKGTGASR